MLSADKFYELMQPQTLSRMADYAALQQMTEHTPWFADAQILRLKMMKEQDHPDFAKMLPHLSLYATHRKTLVEYLQNIDTPQITIDLSLI
jgi:hypothetical protein